MPDLIYLASPYSHADPAQMEARFQCVCQLAAMMMRRGLFVFSPIAHSHPIAMADKAIPQTSECDFWEKYDRVILERCDRVVVAMFDGWKYSKGIAAEIRYAIALGKPISYINPLDYMLERKP